MTKVALVYTSTTPELIETVEQTVTDAIGADVELISYQDPSILSDVRDAGYVTTQPASRLIAMYLQAIQDGAEAILNLCSTVGEVVDAVQPMSRYLGVPVVRIDEAMCFEAARSGQRVGVLATLPTTMAPTCHTIMRAAREINTHPQLIEGLIDGAFGLDQEQFKQVMLEKAQQLQNEVDLFVFAQGSMAYCQDYIQSQTGIKTLSSPVFGAAALREALIKLGKELH